MSYIIRLAEIGDLPAMLSIYSYYVRETAVSFEYEPPSLEEFSRRFGAFTRQFPWFALESEGRVIGYSYAHRFHERAAYDWSAELTVYLDRFCHGKGCGRALYTCLIETLRLQGYKTAIGIISCPNEKSEGLHRALGFVRQGIITGAGFKGGAWRSVAFYALALGEYTVPPAPPLPVGSVRDTPEFKELTQRCAKMIRG